MALVVQAALEIHCLAFKIPLWGREYAVTSYPSIGWLKDIL